MKAPLYVQTFIGHFVLQALLSLHWFTDYKYLLQLWGLWTQSVSSEGATHAPRESPREVAQIHHIQHMLALIHTRSQQVQEVSRLPEPHYFRDHFSCNSHCRRTSDLRNSTLQMQILQVFAQCSSCIRYMFPLSSLEHHPDRWQSFRTKR